MNYDAARQRGSDLRWDYSRTNDGRTWPVGYCHAYEPFGEDDLWLFLGDAARMAAENERLGRHAAKYHADGHATAGEACSCYRRYLLDNRSRLAKVNEDEADGLHRCAKCGEWCANMGEVDGSWHCYLCDAHLTQESLDELFPEVGESYSS